MKWPYISNRLYFSAVGLAVGLGIGAIAEVAKQSIGGKQKAGTNILSSLPCFSVQFSSTIVSD